MNIPKHSLLTNIYTKNGEPYPSHKIIFDHINKWSEISFLPRTIRIGFRCTANENNDSQYILDVFLFDYSKQNDKFLDANKFSDLPVLDKGIIEVELVQEGLIRNTLVPFNPQRNSLYQGSICKKFSISYRPVK